MGWIEDRQKEQAVKVAQMGVEPGDFVNLTTEYGDVWHEIIAVFPPSDIHDDSLLIADCYARMRGCVPKMDKYIQFDYVRSVVKKCSTEIENGVVYFKDGVVPRRLGRIMEDWQGYTLATPTTTDAFWAAYFAKEGTGDVNTARSSR